MRKEKRAMIARIQEINTRFKELADVLETEKRSLTSGEMEERNALTQEKEILQLRLDRMNSGNWAQNEQQMTAERAFTDALVALYQKRNIPEVAEDFMSGYNLMVPANRSIQDSTTVTPLIPLTIAEIIEPLEKGLILDKVGAKMQYGMVGTWQFPIVAGIEATLEDENAEVADTTIDISKISPSPKRVALSIPVSNRAIDQSNTAILEVVRKQLSMGLARLLNKWMFNKTKITSKASEGCFVKAYASPAVTFAADVPSWREVLQVETAVLEKGVPMDGSGCWVCTASMLAKLKSAPKDKGSGRFIVEDNMIDGYPIFTTEYVDKDMLGFGVFSYELVGQFGQMRITFDPYTGAKKNLVYFVLNTDFDMLTLRDEAFAIGKTPAPVSGGA